MQTDGCALCLWWTLIRTMPCLWCGSSLNGGRRRRSCQAPIQTAGFHGPKRMARSARVVWGIKRGSSSSSSSNSSSSCDTAFAQGGARACLKRPGPQLRLACSGIPHRKSKAGSRARSSSSLWGTAAARGRTIQASPRRARRLRSGPAGTSWWWRGRPQAAARRSTSEGGAGLRGVRHSLAAWSCPQRAAERVFLRASHMRSLPATPCLCLPSRLPSTRAGHPHIHPLAYDASSLLAGIAAALGPGAAPAGCSGSGGGGGGGSGSRRADVTPSSDDASDDISGGGYVLFLDDDVALHPGTIGRLVDELEGDPSAFMATGARLWHTVGGWYQKMLMSLCAPLALRDGGVEGWWR